jgi:PsbP
MLASSITQRSPVGSSLNREISNTGRSRRSAVVASSNSSSNNSPKSSPSSDILTHTAPLAFSRRALLAAGPTLLALAPAFRAGAFTPPPPGLRFHQDKLDGYSFFFYPEDWLPVTTSGNDVFFRNPFNAEENLFVDVSSPSSSKFESVSDLGSPETAAAKNLDQFLEEFMSTRLGVKRQGEVLSAVARTGDDGLQYYDIQTRVKSYASRNQLAVTQTEIDQGIELEWDRRFLTVLGVANKRLYSWRLQTSNKVFEKDPERLLSVAKSFQCKEV